MSNIPTRVILTGHSRGLGAAIADALASRGVDVLALARSAHASLAERHGARIEQVELDLADNVRVAAWLAGGALARFAQGAARIVLINNAGTVQPIGPLAVQAPADVAHAVALNVATPMMFASAVAALGDGVERRIVHIQSGAGRNAYAGWSVYCATKAALDHHARAVAEDANGALAICSLAPGVIDTDMQGEIRASGLEQFPMRERFEAMKRDGQLSAPDASAAKIVDYVLGDAFGQTPVADIRELS